MNNLCYHKPNNNIENWYFTSFTDPMYMKCLYKIFEATACLGWRFCLTVLCLILNVIRLPRANCIFPLIENNMTKEIFVKYSQSLCLLWQQHLENLKYRTHDYVITSRLSGYKTMSFSQGWFVDVYWCSSSESAYSKSL